MNNRELYYSVDMPDKNFCVDIGLSKVWETGYGFKEHWHEYLQIFYIVNGEGFIRCNSETFTVHIGDVVIVNSREMHYIESTHDDFRFYLFRIDLPFLFSNQVDLCQTKYLAPLSENLILFKNLIRGNEEIVNCIKIIIQEYFNKDIGYELAVKANIYNLVVILLRNCIDKYVTPRYMNHKINTGKRFNDVFVYIEDNYNKDISTSELSDIAHISTYYFCRIFKQTTGKTPTEYINEVRLRKSIELMKKETMNITEIAIESGFNDANYFSRLFKKKYGVSPSKYQ